MVGWQEEVGIGGGGGHLIYLTIRQTRIRLPVHVAYWTKQENFPSSGEFTNSPHEVTVHGMGGRIMSAPGPDPWNL